MTITTQSFFYGKTEVILEAGRIARQASGAVFLTMGDIKILATVVGKKDKVNHIFFPLTVNYQEKSYAVGKIPGSFFKREGRPSEKEILTSRLIDRPLRPLFPKGFMHEVQVICTVMSANKTDATDIPAMIAASAAVSISGIPFNGPLGAARVGFIDNEFVLNPTYQDLEDSSLNMIVSGTSDAVMMVESDAKQLSEEHMLDGIDFAHQQMQTVISAINEFSHKVNTPVWQWQEPLVNTELKANLADSYTQQIASAYNIVDKVSRVAELASIREEAYNKFVGEDITQAEVSSLFHKLEKTLVRNKTITNKIRIDGRDLETVRSITPEVSILPNIHGSSLFTRGETQAIATVTLGSMRDAQKIDDLSGYGQDRFMLHYNFPPFCVGETGMVGSPKRREIGHGFLAKRALISVLPSMDDFPYALRLVSEITESNGSSSMATVCGCSLALMDAGVPITAPVAGVAMGLIKEQEDYVILTDILGDEDHLGDMDFKVAGTENGVTVLQMDIKIEGISRDIMQQALLQAKDGRLHILSTMNEVLSAARTEVSANAPVAMSLKINPSKIRDVIGKGGSTIRAIIEDTGAEIDINDNGTVSIYAQNKEKSEYTIKLIKDVCFEPEVGSVYSGTVTKILDFGAFVAIAPGTEGLVHISQISDEHIDDINDFLKVNQQVDVVVLGVDFKGKIKLSMRIEE